MARRAAKTIAKTTTAADEQPDKAQLLDFYRSMLLIRRFEERAGQLYGMGLIGGFCHTLVMIFH